MNQSKDPVEAIKSLTSDEISKLVLRGMGLTVEKLEEPNDRKESDFLAYHGNEIFLVEAKIKEDEKKEVVKRERVLSKGEIYTKNDTLGRDETISKTLSNARNQLISSARVHKHNLRVVLHISTGINSKAKCEKALDTLLGRTNIFNMNDSSCKPCYFYSFSDFYRYRHAFDAAFVGYLDSNADLKLSIYLNPHSPRYEAEKIAHF